MALPTDFADPHFDPTDPRSMTPEQRHEELCALLATGARRVLALRAGPGGTALAAPTPLDSDASETPPDSAPDGLELSRQKSVHVPRG